MELQQPEASLPDVVKSNYLSPPRTAGATLRMRTRPVVGQIPGDERFVESRQSVAQAPKPLAERPWRALRL